jgi:DNA-binding Xre family transcriptional regulator
MAYRELICKVGTTIASISILKSGNERPIRLLTIQAFCHNTRVPQGDDPEHMTGEASGLPGRD